MTDGITTDYWWINHSYWCMTLKFLINCRHLHSNEYTVVIVRLFFEAPWVLCAKFSKQKKQLKYFFVFIFVIYLTFNVRSSSAAIAKYSLLIFLCKDYNFKSSHKIKKRKILAPYFILTYRHFWYFNNQYYNCINILFVMRWLK